LVALALLAVLIAVFAGPLKSLSVSAEALPPIKPAFVAFSHWGVNATYLVAYPGASFMPLTITLLYEGPVTLYNVNVTLNVSYPLSLVQGEPTPRLQVLELQPGQELTMFGLFNVSGQASPGVYNETLNVTYAAEVQTPLGAETIKGSSSVRFTVAITGYSSLEVEGFRTVPPLIYAGMQAAELVVYIANKGTSPASNITVTLNVSSPLYPLYPGSNVVRIPYLPPGYTVNLTFPLGLSNVTKLASMSFGNYEVPEPYNATVDLILTGNGLRYVVPLTLYVAPSAYFVLVASSYPHVTPGSSDFYVTVTLGNVGTSKARFVTVTLLPNPVFTPYISSSENPIIALSLWNCSLGDVNAGAEANATFVLSVSSAIRPGTYYLPLLVSWLQPPTMQPMHEVIMVPVSVSPSFSFASLSLHSSTTTLYLVAAIVVIIIVVMAALGRRRS
jgi:hypothetical protein